MTQARPNVALRLLDLLEIKQIEENLYQGGNENRHGMRLFGGQVMAQASNAAYRTVEGLHMHSLHGYFLRPGDAQLPVLYEVERVRDGRTFTTRRVVAIQRGKAIFNMDASFQYDEIGLEHASLMPNVPLPGELQDDIEVARALGGPKADPRMSPMATVERPFHMRSVFEIGSAAWAENRTWSPTWIKFKEPDALLGQDNGRYENPQALARCLLTYASDMGLVSTASMPHQRDEVRSKFQMASLDHAIWVHRSVPIDQWLLFHKRTSTAQGSRGMVHADFFSEQGALIASVTQEGLMRLPRAED